MKKTILSLSILSATIAFGANQYVTIIDRPNNEYITNIEAGGYTEYSEWTTISTSNCVYTNNWTVEEVYKGVDYTKTSTCDETQERTKDVYVYDENDLPVLDSSTTEQQTISVTNSEELTGVFEARNCKEILDSHGNQGDGNYTLYVNGSSFYTYCDMTNGGWTLAMRLKNSGQLNGSGRDNFWNSGGQLSSSYAYTPFSSGFDNTEMGFLGWDRIKGMLNSNNLEILVKGTNSIGLNVNESYTLQNFNPTMSDTTTDTGNLLNGGVYTISKKGDSGTRSNWGTCGTNSMTDAHVGLGLCTSGYNGNGPYGREVQIWHYGSSYTSYNYTMNVSFSVDGNNSSNITYNNSKNYDFLMFIK